MKKGTAEEQKTRKVFIGESSSLYEPFGGVDGEEVEADLLELVFEGAMVDRFLRVVQLDYLVDTVELSWAVPLACP